MDDEPVNPLRAQQDAPWELTPSSRVPGDLKNWHAWEEGPGHTDATPLVKILSRGQLGSLQIQQNKFFFFFFQN